MLNIQDNVKEINIYKNAILNNSHHDRDYFIKKYLEIKFFNDKEIKLDLDCGADITNCDYLKIINKGKLVKSLFRSNLMD